MKILSTYFSSLKPLKSNEHRFIALRIRFTKSNEMYFDSFVSKPKWNKDEMKLFCSFIYKYVFVML